MGQIMGCIPAPRYLLLRGWHLRDRTSLAL